MQGPADVDLLVVGGGMGGLTTAALAQHLGMKTALLEGHTKLGGCAGYFSRGPYTFDAGATALMGLGPTEPLGGLLSTLEIDFEGVENSGYRVHLPDRTLDLTADSCRFVKEVLDRFSGAIPSTKARLKDFWHLQGWVGSILFKTAGRIPRLPVRSVSDALHDLRILGLEGICAASTSLLTMQDVLRLVGLDRERPFLALIAMLLQDTAQAGPEVVPFANAAACLQAYRYGLRRPKGGMKTMIEGIAERFSALGGDLRTATIVDRIESIDGGFLVTTRRRESIRARQVALNLPLNLAATLLGRSLKRHLGRAEKKSRAIWSGFTGYLAVQRGAIADSSPLFHHVLRSYAQPTHDGNNVLISLSSPGDDAYGPPTVRVATLSTHTRPEDWLGLDRSAYKEKKANYANRLQSALEIALPGAKDRIVHAEYATPRSFARYTRRTDGAVGGAPTRRLNSNLFSVPPDLFGPGIWIVGDSVFPGQGTMATAISAIRVVEQLTGIPWSRILRSRSLAEDERPPNGVTSV